MTDTPDPVAAYLAEVRDRTEQRVINPGSLPITHPGVRGLMEAAGAVPRLLAAAEVALAWHQPVDADPQVCISCTDGYAEHEEWPCGEYMEIANALLTESGGDGAAASTVPRPPADPPPHIVAARLLTEQAEERGEEPGSVLRAIAEAGQERDDD